MKGNHALEGLFRKFLRAGNFFGIALGGWYAVASTILRYGLSTNAFLNIKFLILFFVAAVVGFILGGAWEVLLELAFPRYEYNGAASEAPATRFILVEGGVRWGLPVGFFCAVGSTFARPGISWDPFLWLEFLFSLVLYLPAFFLGGCVFGLFMLETLKRLKAPVEGNRD